MIDDILSFKECMKELSDIIKNKEKSSVSERMKAIGILIDLKNDEIKKQKENSDDKDDDTLSISIDYGENYENNSRT